MCCEQDECALAVFNEVEASCYLKGYGALEVSPRDAVGVSTYTIDEREEGCRISPETDNFV